MTFQGNIQDLQVAEVVDSSGTKVGKVGQVYLTDGTQEPSWVTVNTGFFGTNETFIPLAEARFADGSITVPYEKAFIKDAPNVDEDGSISPEQEDELYRYYGVEDTRGTYEDNRPRDGVDTDRARRDETANTGVGTAGAAGAAGTAGLAGGAADRDRDVTSADTGIGADRERAAGGQHAGVPGDDATRRGVVGGTDRDVDVDGRESVTLHEERANVGTERVETGRVRLRKHVITDTETVQVPVEREELVVERTPVDGTAPATGTVGEEEVDVTLHEERPVVDTETVATEQVNVGKRTVSDTQNVTTKTAREELDVEGGDEVGRGGRGVGTDRDGRGVDADRRDDRL